MTLDDAALQQLRANAERLACAALEAAAQELLDELPPAAVAAPAQVLDDAQVSALLDPSRMDLSLLDGLGQDSDDAAAPLTTAEMAAELAALPQDLTPLTSALDTAAFEAWLTLYRSGHEGLHRLVASLQAGA